MISFFRKALSSWVVLGLLGLVLVAFVVTGVNTPDMGGGSTTAQGETVAKFGRRTLGAAELESRAQAAYRQAQQQNQGLGFAQYVAGGFDQLVQEVVAGTTLEVYARQLGLTASKRMIDGEIASIPAFRGPGGQFDEGAMRAVLAQQRVPEGQLRDDIAADAIRRQMLVPVTAGSRAPGSLVLPYASLLLETRSGSVGFVPAAAFAGGAAPTDAELQRWYDGHRTRYVVPERRALRYALVGPGQVAAEALPTEAEIAAAYKADASFQPSERRALVQVIADSEAKARAFAAAVRGGQAFDAAARAAGLSAAPVAPKTKAELADLASPALADAAFGATQGALIGPARSDFGWHVARVERIDATAGRPLAAVRGELAAKVGADKAKRALADKAAKIDDALAGGASFDEVVRAERLTVATTPPLTPTAESPDRPGYAPAPELAALLRQVQQMGAEDDPVVATIVPEQSFALVGVTQVIPAAAPPLAAVRARVAAEFSADRALSRARAVADAIVAKANGGTALAAAFAQAPVRLTAPSAAGGRRADLGRDGQPVPPGQAALFSLAAGRARAVPAADGVWVARLDRIVPGDAARVPGVLAATQGQFTGVLGEEYAIQFANAARAALGVTVDAAAIARTKARLAGGGQ